MAASSPSTSWPPAPFTGADLRADTTRNDFDLTSLQAVADMREGRGAFPIEQVRVDGPPIPWIWLALGSTQCGDFRRSAATS
jgi:hypothetical protein